MLPHAVRGEADDLARFRRITGAALLSTFLLIILGCVVRVSDSGLGCGAAHSGTHGWPLCGGRVVPFIQTNMIIEYSHRIAATVVAVLIGALLFLALRRLREHRWLVRGSAVAAVLVLFQAVLGGLTVEHGLATALVAAHLGTAMVLFALLLSLRRATDPAERAAPASTAPIVRRAAAIAAVAVLVTIVAGGVIAGTEEKGTGVTTEQGAHLACGKEFPTCLDGVLPFGAGEMVDIQLAHRLAMVLAAIAVLTMAIVAGRRGVPGWAFRLAPVLLVCQILLGAMNVWLGEHAVLVVAHLTLATVLWATVVWAGLSLVRVPSPVPAPFRGEPRPEAAAA